MSHSQPRPIPVGRANRAARLGGASLSIAGNMAVSGARELLSGRRPELRGLMLTPANIGRLTAELARMRGAAMKVGQLVSMDAGDVLPPEIADIIARLRADADFMPPKQLRDVLDAEWGPGWMKRFQRFNVRPVAAASIGQVHEAVDRDGRHLAIKVQYPGVKESIDSDVSNVGALVKVSGIVPSGIDLGPLLEEAKRQLHDEADYAREARELQRFGQWLAGDARFAVPDYAEEFSTDRVLAMSYLKGQPVEALEAAPQEERDHVAATLFELTLRELFEFGRMQSDPNFANYRHDGARVLLLDFGAARAVPAEIAQGYRGMLAALMAGDRAGMDAAALVLGVYAPGTSEAHKTAILDLILRGRAGIGADGVFDFGNGALRRELTEAGMRLAEDQAFLHLPPVETLYVQRKLAGMFLLASRLRARVNLAELFAPWLGSGDAAGLGSVDEGAQLSR
ncbi:MAG: AarF/ABC1/UbiB kinase family protein [Pseudomonadota bacterium]